MPESAPAVESLVEIGWSPGGAVFLLGHRADRRLRQVRRRLFGERAPREHRQGRQKAVIPGSLRTRVFERDAYRCRHCGGWVGLSVDHIQPESRGGTLELDNLQTLCRSCNSRKGARV